MCTWFEYGSKDLFGSWLGCEVGSSYVDLGGGGSVMVA